MAKERKVDRWTDAEGFPTWRLLIFTALAGVLGVTISNAAQGLVELPWVYTLPLVLAAGFALWRAEEWLWARRQSHEGAQ